MALCMLVVGLVIFSNYLQIKTAKIQLQCIWLGHQSGNEHELFSWTNFNLARNRNL